MSTPGSAGDYLFEQHALVLGEARGYADVFYRNRFAWENKAPGKNLDAALRQLQQYSLALGNPPLLVVCDRLIIRIHTQFNGHPSETHLIRLPDLADQAASLRALAAQSRQTDTAQTQAAAARHSAQMRARAGLASELDALALDAPWLAQRRQAVELNTRRQQARVGLIKALGGGYASSDFAENTQ